MVTTPAALTAIAAWEPTSFAASITRRTQLPPGAELHRMVERARRRFVKDDLPSPRRVEEQARVVRLRAVDHQRNLRERTPEHGRTAPRHGSASRGSVVRAESVHL